MKLIHSFLLIFSISTLFISCGNKFTNNLIQNENKYPNHVGDISYDPKLDGTFSPCDSTYSLQYYNFQKGVQYKGEKYAIIQTFKEKFSNKFIKNQTGYITIRFVVNCKGETGMFRLEQMNLNYEKTTFKKIILEELLDITKSLDGWIIGTAGTKSFDYYQYLTFKIQEGKIIDILP